jgi:hypothetical protein
MSSIPYSVYSKSLDDIATQWLKNTNPADELEIKRAIARAILQMSEELLASPKVTLKVNGENVVVPLLAQGFGIKGLIHLLETDSINFLFWNQDITFLLDDKVAHQNGLIPIQSMFFNDPAHSSPEASIKMGIKGWGNFIPSNEIDKIRKLVLKNTIIPKEGLAAQCVHRVVSAHSGNQLADCGLPSSFPIDRLTRSQRQQMCSIGADLLEGIILIYNDGAFVNTGHTWESLKACFQSISKGNQTCQTLESIVEIANLPAIDQMILNKYFTTQDVPTLREKKETKQFQEWLWTRKDPSDSSAVIEEYLSILSAKASPVKKNFFKVGRICTIGLAGSALGAAGVAAAGPIGGAAGFALGTSIGTGVSLIDEFVLGKIKSDKNPQHFITNVLGVLSAKGKYTQQTKKE